jgi:hypothetical protein
MKKPALEKKMVESPVFWSAGNCWSRTGREYFITELMRYINVSSYGRCMNNRQTSYGYEYERFGSSLDSGDIQFGIPGELARKHLFYLALENSNCEDYVTEKLWKAFYAGVVPIVDGPLDYDKFLPSDRSVIRADAFPSISDLAHYLLYLTNNRTAYMEYLPWKQNSSSFVFRESFLRLFPDTGLESVQEGDRLCYLKSLVEKQKKGKRISASADQCESHGKWMPFHKRIYQMAVTEWEVSSLSSDIFVLATLLCLGCVLGFRTRMGYCVISPPQSQDCK